MGVIGILADGVVLYNGLDGEGRDAGAHEVLDACAGHPDQGSIYHHHDVPPCILKTVRAGQTKLVGYALDGYGVYVTKDAAGNLPTDADLDACHGTTSAVPWDGRTVTMYHYVATLEYPYTVGCYHGTPISIGKGSGSGGGQQGQSQQQGTQPTGGRPSQGQTAQQGPPPTGQGPPSGGGQGPPPPPPGR
jgi:hypothetical protein